MSKNEDEDGWKIFENTTGSSRLAMVWSTNMVNQIWTQTTLNVWVQVQMEGWTWTPIGVQVQDIALTWT